MDFFSLSLAGILYLLMQLAVTVNIILYKDDVKSSIGWIGLVWLTPLLGTIIYIVFGINRIKRKALALRNSGPDIFQITGKTQQEIEKEIPPPFLQLMKLGHKVHPQLFTLGNSIKPLQNGDEAYPLMCEAIRNAKKEVLIESYIFNNDKAGQMFIDALKQARKNGAKVKMLIDGVGINYSKPTIKAEALKIEGLNFAVFLPSRQPVDLPFVNLRNHRKIMIIDGYTAFFGGMNVAKGNLIADKPKDPIIDITFMVRGPVIDQMNRIFLEDWIFAKKHPFVPISFREKEPLPGNIPTRIIPDGPDSDYGKIELLTLGALNCAQKKVSIVTPYFLPEGNILTALEMASMRGVEVEIVIPSKSNIFGMDWAMEANFETLIKKDIKIYRTKPPFDHSKIMIVDNGWVFTGSSNWDVRSFKLNFETNMECLSPELARLLIPIVEAKKKNAILLKTHKLPMLTKLRNNSFKLLTPYY